MQQNPQSSITDSTVAICTLHLEAGGIVRYEPYYTSLRYSGNVYGSGLHVGTYLCVYTLWDSQSFLPYRMNERRNVFSVQIVGFFWCSWNVG